VAVREKVDDSRIVVFVESLKLRQLEFVDRLLVEKIDLSRVMKRSRDDILKNFRLVDPIAWLGEIYVRDGSYIDQVRRLS
jgi:hypothetical protein